MKKLLIWIGSKRAFWRKTLLAAAMLGATVAAFYWGRMGVASRVDAQQVQPRPGTPGQPANQPPSDYSKRVVAYLYGNVPITREELGEYLIARFGQERIEIMINHRIVEMYCQARGIFVTDAEVDAQFKKELQDFGPNMTMQDFVNQVLKPFKKTLYEWKEDVIRPKLLLSKLCRPDVQVTQDDLNKAFEARYGPKVQCRMIAFAKDNKKRTEIWARVSQNEEEFAKEAKYQYLSNLASIEGKIPPINKHFADQNIETAAFRLKPGETSPLIELPDGTFIMLKCYKHIPADLTKKFGEERVQLDKELREVKLTQKIQETFTRLREQAQPRVLITNQVRQADLERDVARNLGVSGNGTPPRPTPPTGN